MSVSDLQPLILATLAGKARLSYRDLHASIGGPAQELDSALWPLLRARTVIVKGKGYALPPPPHPPSEGP